MAKISFPKDPFDDDIFKERALPEAILFKQQILWACYNYIESLAEYNKRKLLNRATRHIRATMQSNLITIYMQIKMKFTKDGKLPKELANLDKLGIEMTVEEMSKCFDILQNRIEEMGITRVETRVKSPYHAFKRGRRGG